MSLFDMFKKKGKTVFTEKDNVGTRQDTFSMASSYWMCERPGLSVKPPFTLFIMPSGDSAKAALLELPFIHEASDSGKLVCDRLMTFGYYGIPGNDGKPSGRCEAIVCGNDLTLAEFRLAEDAFARHGGTRKNSDEPSAAVKASKAAGKPGRVKYKEKVENNGATYEVYTGPDKASAMAFLKGKTVTKRMYYICVDTPEGSFGRDINGIYQE